MFSRYFNNSKQYDTEKVEKIMRKAEYYAIKQPQKLESFLQKHERIQDLRQVSETSKAYDDCVIQNARLDSPYDGSCHTFFNNYMNARENCLKNIPDVDNTIQRSNRGDFAIYKPSW